MFTFYEIVQVTLAIIGCIVSGYFYLQKRKSDLRKKAKEICQVEGERLIRQGFIQKRIPENLDVIVIGSGMGGLTTASILAQSGHRVLVLEQHDVAGGNLHTFTEKGYEFDTGVHYIGGYIHSSKSPIGYVMKALTSGLVEWERMSEEFDIPLNYNTGEKFPMNQSFTKTKESLLAAFPEPADQKSIHKYFDLLSQARNSLGFNILLTRVIPKFLHSTFKALFLSKDTLLGKTTKEVLDSISTNTKLKGVLGYIYGDYGAPPSKSSFIYHAMVYNHYRGGSFYPKGGPSTISMALVATIRANGGTVLVRAPVDEILIGKNTKGDCRAIGVSVKGKKVMAPIVISAAGCYNTFKKLVPEQCRDIVKKEIDLIDSERPSCSLMSVFVGLKSDGKDLGLPSSNVWAFPSWDHDSNFENFDKDCVNNDPAAVFMSFSSVKDSTYKERFPGRQNALVIGPANYEWFAKHADEKIKHRGQEYNDLKKLLEKKFLDVFLNTFPNLKDHVDFVDSGTPLTNNYYLGNYQGEVYGMTHSVSRLEESVLSASTPIKGLYLSGQDLFSCGVAGAMFGGLFSALAVSKKSIMALV